MVIYRLFSLFKVAAETTAASGERQKDGGGGQGGREAERHVLQQDVARLRKHGISKMDDRKSWPITLLKQVHGELTDETPDNLLSQELWLVANTSQQWWRLVQNITRSFAVMSVIGYITGLGDRHLDNVLVSI